MAFDMPWLLQCFFKDFSIFIKDRGVLAFEALTQAKLTTKSMFIVASVSENRENQIGLAYLMTGLVPY